MTLLFISCILLAGCCKQKSNRDLDASNPFFQDWNTPYGVPPFDKIESEHYLPAFTEAMLQHKEEIDAIVNNKKSPTFKNTIEALEYSGELLNKVSAVFSNLALCMNSDEMKAISDSVSPLVTMHGDDIMLNAQLFERIKAVYDQRESLKLNPEQKRLLEEKYKSFVRGGANVPVEKQARFREINERISKLALDFSNNILTATNSYKLIVDNKARLAGLSESQIAAAAEAANKDEATKGKFVFTIHLPSMEPFLQQCQDRELRKELWTAYSSRCTSGETNNMDIINELVNLRLEKANILGYASHAAYILDDNMAKNPETVNNLLNSIWEPALAKATEEAQAYNDMIKAEGGKFKLEPYDWRYYTEKLRKEKYDLNDETIAPYFSLNAVKEGIFEITNKLFGITFHENKELPVYHESVEAFEVKEGGKVIAILYMDYHPRASKRSGAWMTNYREGNMGSKSVIPVVSLVMNFTAPVGDKPALLNFDQTETFFHEFGHALHSILSKCYYTSLGGTNVSRDFVELPSQIMEKWAGEPEVLKMYAKHYETGEVIPDELIAKLEAAAHFGQGFINTELLAASFLDMDYHTITKPTQITLPDFENQTLTNRGLIPEIISRYKSPYFQHIFASSVGYSAGYYSYTWSAVLDNDAFEAFKEKGIFNQEVAKSFRTNILEKGNSEDPMELYIKFRGQEPSSEALLKNRGLK